MSLELTFDLQHVLNECIYKTMESTPSFFLIKTDKRKAMLSCMDELWSDDFLNDVAFVKRHGGFSLQKRWFDAREKYCFRVRDVIVCTTNDILVLHCELTKFEHNENTTIVEDVVLLFSNLSEPTFLHRLKPHSYDVKIESDVFPKTILDIIKQYFGEPYGKRRWLSEWMTNNGCENYIFDKQLHEKNPYFTNVKQTRLLRKLWWKSAN
jgi:hypothetical protein